jgi:hypothetical protein
LRYCGGRRVKQRDGRTKVVRDAKKPGHGVLALPVSALVQVPGLPPNLQPLFEGEFERNAAAFGAVLVLMVFPFPFAHVESYWLRIIFTSCRRDRPGWRWRLLALKLVDGAQMRDELIFMGRPAFPNSPI